MPSIDELRAKMGKKEDEPTKEHSKEELADKVTEMKEKVGSSIRLTEEGDMESGRAIIHIEKLWKEGKTVTDEVSDEDFIDVQVPVEGVPLATVGFNCKMTLNLGDFESVSVGVFASVPCYKEEMDTAFIMAKKFVDKRLNKEVDAIVKYRDEKRKKSS